MLGLNHPCRSWGNCDALDPQRHGTFLRPPDSASAQPSSAASSACKDGAGAEVPRGFPAVLRTSSEEAAEN